MLDTWENANITILEVFEKIAVIYRMSSLKSCNTESIHMPSNTNNNFLLRFASACQSSIISDGIPYYQRLSAQYQYVWSSSGSQPLLLLVWWCETHWLNVFATNLAPLLVLGIWTSLFLRVLCIRCLVIMHMRCTSDVLHYAAVVFVGQLPDSNSRTCAEGVSAEQAANNWLKSAESDVGTSSSTHSAFAVRALLIHCTSLWPPYVIGGPLYFCPVVSFYLLLPIFFFFFFSSPNLSGHRLDVYHTSTHGVALVRI